MPVSMKDLLRELGAPEQSGPTAEQKKKAAADVERWKAQKKKIDAYLDKNTKVEDNVLTGALGFQGGMARIAETPIRFFSRIFDNKNAGDVANQLGDFAKRTEELSEAQSEADPSLSGKATRFVSQMAPEIMTGGIAARALKGTALAAKAGKYIGKIPKLGKAAKLNSEIANEAAADAISSSAMDYLRTGGDAIAALKSGVAGTVMGTQGHRSSPVQGSPRSDARTPVACSSGARHYREPQVWQ
jgi:hypothetical protein